MEIQTIERNNKVVKCFYFKYKDFKPQDVLERQLEKILQRIESKYGLKDNFILDVGQTQEDIINNKQTLKLEFKLK